MIKRQVQLHKMAHFEVEIDSSNPMYLISISSNRHKLKCMHVYMATVNFQFYKILKLQISLWTWQCLLTGLIDEKILIFN